MTVVYFGPRWDAPMLDGAVRIETPIGEPCERCRELIVDGDQGTELAIMEMKPRDDGTLGPVGRSGFLHAECEAIGIVGHQHGVCTCTGYDTSRRAAARELWRRLGHAA